jgi:hypothetical protein
MLGIRSSDRDFVRFFVLSREVDLGQNGGVLPVVERQWRGQAHLAAPIPESEPVPGGFVSVP